MFSNSLQRTETIPLSSSTSGYIPRNPGNSICLEDKRCNISKRTGATSPGPRGSHSPQTNEEFREIPKEPGLYRIRPAGKDFLMYIGETRRTVHERLNELRHTLKRTDLMPWNDPHTAAPSLWAWQDAEGFEYECSAAPLDASINGRRGMESFLLYRYRQEYGESTLCNFGRFHPRYRKSTNRKENLRGGKLEEGHKDNPAGGPSHPPLPATGNPGDPDWMGLVVEWCEPLVPEKIQDAPAGPGLYILIDVRFAGDHLHRPVRELCEPVAGSQQEVLGRERTPVFFSTCGERSPPASAQGTGKRSHRELF